MKKETEYLTPGAKFRRLDSSQCTEVELLAIIINSGTKNRPAKKIAEDLLDKFGTVYDLPGKRLCDLMEIEGIGPVKATQIAAVFELCRRIIRHMERE
jgi:DNA repair protein RadC